MAIINYQHYRFGVHKVINDSEKLQSLHGDRPEIVNLLKKNIGKDIFIQAKDTNDPTCWAYLPDCTFLPNMKKDILNANSYVSFFL